MDREEDKDNVRELNIPEIERYLDIHKKQIIDSIMERMFKGSPKKIKMVYDDFDRLIRELIENIPFGSMIQFALANTLMYSLWFGYQSQIVKNDPSVDFKDEYIEQIQDVIIKAYNEGRDYVNEKPH
jgi:hypothetical protein